MVSDRQQRFAGYRLVFQPQVNLAESQGRTYSLFGVEALLRSNDNIAPLEIIRRAELSGDLDKLEEWALRSASEQGVEWLNAGHQTRISLNISGSHIDKPLFAGMLAKILMETGMPPQLLTLEISERRLLNNSSIGLKALNSIRSTGVSLLRDNFGTKYAWLPDLNNSPFSGVKIAPSFVQDVENAAGRAVVKSVIDLCQARGLDTIASGVESEAQRDILLDLGCTIQQGQLFSHPLTPVMTEFLYLRSSTPYGSKL